MANNLYVATETLISAYRDALESQPYNRIQVYAELMNFKEPTISELLLGCITTVPTVFDSKQSLRSSIQDDNDSKTADYILNNVVAKISAEETIAPEKYPKSKITKGVDALLNTIKKDATLDIMKPLEHKDINIDDIEDGK